MTYGTHVQVYELGFAECSKSYVFKGSKEYTPAQVAQQLGIVGAVRSGPPGQPGAGGAAGDHTSLRPDEPRPMLPCMPSTISRRNAVSAAARVTCQLWRSPVVQRWHRQRQPSGGASSCRSATASSPSRGCWTSCSGTPGPRQRMCGPRAAPAPHCRCHTTCQTQCVALPCCLPERGRTPVYVTLACS